MTNPLFAGYLAEGVGTSNSAFVENTASGYTRQPITLAPLVNGSTYLVGGVTFATAAAAFVVTQRGMYDAPVGGNLVHYWTLRNPVSVAANMNDTLNAGSMTHYFPDLANIAATSSHSYVFQAGASVGTASKGEPILAGSPHAFSGGVIVTSNPFPYTAQPNAIALQMPPGLGWDNATFPLSVSLYDVPGIGRATGVVSLTAEGLFNQFSSALSAPGVTYYVSTAGLDTNPGTSSVSSFASISKAITAANTAAVPALVYVAAGLYNRANSFAGVVPTHDIAFVATGGRVITGTFDAFTAPTKDATYTNTYSYALSNVDRVCDLTNLNNFGNYNDLVNVATAAICNVTPNSWSNVSGVIYINRGDGAAVVNTNTRVYRSSVNCLLITNQINLYMGDGVTGPTATFPPSGFDVEGSSYSGGPQCCFGYQLATPTTTKVVVSVKNCSFKYGGGTINVGAVSVSVNSIYGLAAFFNCRADEAATDGFNHHNTSNSGESQFLTVNCTAVNNGRNPSVSDNGWTSHDTCIGIDVSGYYSGNHGGTCRSINTSRSWLCGTLVENDKGDLAFGGINVGDAYSVANSAKYWCDRTKYNMLSGNAVGYNAEGVAAVIYLRNVWQGNATRGGPGTVTIY